MQALKCVNRQLQDKSQYKSIFDVLSPIDYQCLTKVEITRETPIIDPATGKTVYFDPTSNTIKDKPTTLTIDKKNLKLGF